MPLVNLGLGIRLPASVKSILDEAARMGALAPNIAHYVRFVPS